MESAESPAAWHVLAMDLEGQFVAGGTGGDRALLPCGDWTLVLEGVPEVQPSLMPGARARRRVRRTRLRAPYRGLDSFRFALAPRRTRELVPGLRPVAGFQLGVEAFDNAFVCRVNEVSKARELFGDADLRARLLTQPELQLGTHELSGPRDADEPPLVELWLDERGVVGDIDRLKELVALLGAMLDGLRALGAAEPVPAEEIILEPPASAERAKRASERGLPSLRALPREVPIACFFCARPLRSDEAYVEDIVLSEGAVHPLTCDRHHDALAADAQPPVLGRMRAPAGDEEDAGEEGNQIPWFQDADFHPAWDFEPRGAGPLLLWAALPSAVELFEPRPIAVVHADDPRWQALVGPTHAPPAASPT